MKLIGENEIVLVKNKIEKKCIAQIVNEHRRKYFKFYSKLIRIKKFLFDFYFTQITYESNSL